MGGGSGGDEAAAALVKEGGGIKTAPSDKPRSLSPSLNRCRHLSRASPHAPRRTELRRGRGGGLATTRRLAVGQRSRFQEEEELRSVDDHICGTTDPNQTKSFSEASVSAGDEVAIVT